MNQNATLILEKEFLFFSSLERVGLWRTRLSSFKEEPFLKHPVSSVIVVPRSHPAEPGHYLVKILRLIGCFFPRW